MDQAVLGLDLGTSGLKAALWSLTGRLVAEAEAPYPVERPRAGWAQTEPAAWRSALEQVLQDLAPALRSHDVQAVGLAGQMHGLVLTDAEGSSLGPGMVWSDQRAGGQLARWEQLPGQQRAVLANPLAPGMTGPMLAWTAEHQPDLLQRAERLLLPKDVLRAMLVPGAATDRSDACGTLLWDVPADEWAFELVESLGLPAQLLPPVLSSRAVVGHTDVLASTAGAGGAVPVVTGGADTPAAILGNGGSGSLQVNLGSGGQVLAGAQEPRAEAEPAVHLYADTGSSWYRMAALQNAGLALTWVTQVLALTWEELFAAAASTAAGANGVVFLPFLEGERGAIAPRTPVAGWFGADGRTDRADLARAAVEGMAFAVRRAAGLLPAETRAGNVTLTGGGTRTRLVQQLLADLFGNQVQREGVRSASATGAAILAAEGVGLRLEPEREQESPVPPGPCADAVRDAYRRWTHVLEREVAAYGV